MTPDTSFASRVAFITELARRLHENGTSAQRLEAAIEAVARRLGLGCQAWANPTGLILSFADDDPDSGDVVKIVRLAPGETDLGRLAAADAIAERVLAGELGVVEGRAALRALHQPLGTPMRWLTALAFGLAAACVAGLLRAGPADVVTAAALGLLVGALNDLSRGAPRFAEAFEALAALLVTLVAGAVGAFVWPISLQTVVVSALIVLLPGLMLTNAVSELTAQHWVSGSARVAGAATVLLKLAFGTLLGDQLIGALGWEPLGSGILRVSAAQEWLALAAAGIAFAVLFRAELRDWPLVMASAWVGYLTTRYGGLAFGNEMGVFVAGFTISALSNIYARWRNRPGALIRVPGIILLVPGSVGFRTLSFMFERDYTLGMDTAVTLLVVLVALVAGLLFGNLLAPPRGNL
jgi:uncharacterized membrane protein YjjP (DUF1212 family)